MSLPSELRNMHELEENLEKIVNFEIDIEFAILDINIMIKRT